MKRGRDALPWEESSDLQPQTKLTKGDSPHAPSPAEGNVDEEEEEGGNGGGVSPGSCRKPEPAEGDKHGEENCCTTREDDEENSSLLDHQDPRVRLRVLTCLHAHIDLLSCDAAGMDRLSQALHNRLPKEGNPHVAQQIVRLMSSLVICTSKDGERDFYDEVNGPLSEQSYSVHEQGNIATCRSLDHTCTSHSHVEKNIGFSDDCKPPACTKALYIDKDACPPTSELVLHTVKMLLANGLAETESLTLKLQILCSFYHVVEASGRVSLISLCMFLRKLLGSSNPHIRVRTLHLVAMVMATSRDTDYPLGKEDNLGFFEKYTHDSNPVVRKAALHSWVLLHINGYILTYGCYQAALSLLHDLNADVRTLALQVIGLWVEQSPEEHTNHAFFEVCKMMTDMELCVRIEACKALASMSKIREDLLLQALSKQPLELSAKVEDQSQSSSLITLSESDVDISVYEQGLNILSQSSMGALVHGIEDEFYEVRALSLKALARIGRSSARTRAAIIEVMINLVNDDSRHVRLKAVHELIHAADQSGLQVNDNDLQTVQGILEDIDGSIQDAGRTLFASVKLPSLATFKHTIQTLMMYMQRSQQEEDVWHALYRLGRAHSTYVQVLAKDLLKELKGYLSGEAGLDAPECSCILLLFVGASESNTKMLSLVPSHIQSFVRLLRQHSSDKSAVQTANSTDTKLKKLEAQLCTDEALCIDYEHRRRVHDFLAGAAKSVWNVKNLLLSGMISSSRQVLSGCKRDLIKLLNGLDDDDQVALATYVLHYVECINFVSQSWTYFRLKERRAATTRPSLPDLARRLEFVVKCMQHTYVGQTGDQKLDLLELSTISVLWRMTVGNINGKLEADVESIKNTIGIASTLTPFLQALKEQLLEAGCSSLSNSVHVRSIVHGLVSTFWPRPLIVSCVQRRIAALIIPENDMEHPTHFVPGMPFGITASVFLKNLDKSRVWVRTQVDSVRTDFTFLDAEDYKRVNPFITNLQIHGVSNVFKCVVKAAVVLECPALLGAECAGRGPKGYVLPLTSDNLIYLQPSSNAFC